jgi:hypothetical protein
MDDRTMFQPTTLFTVRIWAEDEGDEAVQEWRGTVRHLPDGRERGFRGWPALISLLEEMANTADG